MNILFVHQNFPAQFKHLAPRLLECGHDVRVLRFGAGRDKNLRSIKEYSCNFNNVKNTASHPWVTDIESKIIRADACYKYAKQLRESGYSPDRIIAHPGWGESLFLKEVWPNARLGIYCEFYYSSSGLDLGFDPEFDTDAADDACRTKLLNVHLDLQFQNADDAISPTIWQADTFPEHVRGRISVLHEGIDTEIACSDRSSQLTLRSGETLSAEDEIITFVARNLEPYRGYHTFMRSIPKVLSKNTKARVIIVGDDKEGGYGPKPSQLEHGDLSWKQIFLREVEGSLTPDMRSRIHFVGRVPHAYLIKILQISGAHVYLTYPFVLSWSFLEAMSIGCPIVASETGPLAEVVQDGHNAIYTDFFDTDQLADNILGLLSDKKFASTLGAAGRQFVIDNYDLQKKCLPNQVRWVEGF